MQENEIIENIKKRLKELKKIPYILQKDILKAQNFGDILIIF